MNTPEEPEWLIAKRKSDRSFRNATLGVWLACFPVAVIMMLASPFEYGARMGVAATLFLLTGLASMLMRRRTEKGSLMRTFSTTLAVFTLVSGTAMLAAGLLHGH